MEGPDFLRIPVTPDMTLVVDEACCIVFEVYVPGTSKMLRRVTITNCDELVGALATARGAVEGLNEQELARRYRERIDVQRARAAVLAGIASWARYGVDYGPGVVRLWPAGRGLSLTRWPGLWGGLTSCCRASISALGCRFPSIAVSGASARCASLRM